MIANVQTSMFSDDTWTRPMICRVLAARAAGKLFQTVGPLTSKLRWPVVVRALLIKNKFF